MSALESALKVATVYDLQLPEVRPALHPELEAVEQAPMQTDDDTTSSVQDVPSLPGGQTKVRFLPNQGEGGSSAEETLQFNPFEL